MENIKKQIGRFTIGRTIGYGGSCKVKIGYDTEDKNRKVAIKIMRADLSKTEKNYVDKEIKAMMNLKHENIIEIIDYGYTDYIKRPDKIKKVQYIALELASKGQLFDFINLE